MTTSSRPLLPLGVLSSLFRALTGAHTLSVYLVFALRDLLPRETTLVMIFDESIHLGVIPALFLLPVCVLLRRWGLALLLTPIAVVCLLWYAPRFLPADATPDAPPALTVLTYNMDGAEDWSAVVDVILDADADVVALQALGPAALAALEPALTPRYPAKRLQPTTAVFSRYPISDATQWQASFDNQRMTLDLDGVTVTLFNVYLPLPVGENGFAVRNREVVDLLARLNTATGPLLVAGSFNLGERTHQYDALRDRFGDAWDAVGRGTGFTYAPGGFVPLARFDYVFYSADFDVPTAEVAGRGGADHHALRVAFALERLD